MKAKVLQGSGYTFDNELIGNTYKVVAVTPFSFTIMVDHVHGKNGRYPIGKVWNVNKGLVQLVDVKKVKQKPKKLKQTKVYLVYIGGNGYEAKRVKSVVVNSETNSVNINTEDRLPSGVVVRKNTSVPFTALDCMRIDTPDGSYCYYFKNGVIYTSAQDYSKDRPFKTAQY